MTEYINARIAELQRINKEDSNLLANAPPETNIPREVISNVLKLREACIDELELLKSHLETLKTQKVFVKMEKEDFKPNAICYKIGVKGRVMENDNDLITHVDDDDNSGIWLKETILPSDFDEKFVKEFEDFYFESGEDYILWDEEKEPYPAKRILDAMKKKLEEMKSKIV